MYRLLIISLLAIAATTVSGHVMRRSIGSKKAKIAQFPYIVSLQINKSHFCGGSIISKKWVVTAAHCLEDLDEFWPSNATVLAGTLLRYDDYSNNRYKIARTITHKGYIGETCCKNKLKNDIGLVQIVGEFKDSISVRPIKIGYPPKSGEICTAAGWGTIELGVQPDELRYVKLMVSDMHNCIEHSENHPTPFYAGLEQVCTMADKGKRTCEGDSGGPLVCHGKLAGIVSSGGKNCTNHWENIHTSPRVYIDWLYNHTGVKRFQLE